MWDSTFDRRQPARAASRVTGRPAVRAVTWIAGLLWVATSNAYAQPLPRQLTVEYRVAPLAVDEPRPRLAWQLTPTEGVRGERQSAYRVLVASSARLLADDTGDLWDTGQVASSRTAHVVYEGKPLQPMQTAFWKVRAWDGAARASAWSEPSTWTAGLLTADNWKAEWIAGPAAGQPAPIWTDRRWLDGGDRERTQEALRGFRARVDIPRDRPLRDVVLRFAAEEGRARVHVDGRFVHAPQKAGFVETVDLSALLSPGPHVVAVSVGPAPKVSIDPRKPAALPALRLVAEVVATPVAGDPIVVPFGPSTKTLAAPRELPAGWAGREFDDARWPAARARVPVTGLVSFEQTLPPATYVRTSFTVDRPLRRALIHGSALGDYELHLNGARVGRDHLTPGYTDYRHTLYYNTYDVTAQVRPGVNALGAIVADGWYAGYLGFRRNRGAFGPRHAVSAVLDLEFADGTRQQVVTDRSWKASTGPILTADQLQGSTWDSRLDLPGWDTVAFSTSGWRNAETVARPEARLSAYPGEPVRVMRRVPAQSVTEPVRGVHVIDFGQNLVGWVGFRVNGRAGQKLVLRHGEMLNADGTVYTENLRSARATDVFYLKGGEETLEPRFTFHGFRYAEVTGLDTAPAPETWTAAVIYNDLRETGAFASSHDLVNRIFANTMWGQRGNYVEVPTDCPQRDERMGWMGDAQVFARTASYNMDVSAFMTKWLVDVRDAQLPEGAFSDISPRVSDAPRSGAPGWGDAGVIVPWTMYLQYGDLRALERQYDAMTRWIAWVDGGNPDHLWKQRVGNNYGDWLSPEGQRVKELYATAYYAHSTHLVAEVARLLGKADEARRYTELRDRIRAAFTKAYVSPDGTLQGDTQTAYLLALRFDVVPREMRARLAEKLYARIAARDGHLGTGFLGVNILLPTLTDLGREDLAYQLLTKTTYPSWGYSIVNGATTIWERWNSYTKETGFGDVGMNSFNHYAYGSGVEWLYTTVLGIDAAEPGFTRIRIAPRPGAPLAWARGHYDSLHGRIASDWRVEAGRLTLDVTVPPNTTAEIHVPAKGAGEVTEGGRPAREAAGLALLREGDGVVVFQVGSGSYRFGAPRP
jgi:alpha-L-rhamnosidase